MQDTAKNPNVLEACSVEGRLDNLRMLSEQLETCQKSLSEYLDTKRCAFPRFVNLESLLLKGKVLECMSSCIWPPRYMHNGLYTYQESMDISVLYISPAAYCYSQHIDQVSSSDMHMLICLHVDEPLLDAYSKPKHVCNCRFFFISDDELLSVLGTADPTSIQEHMLKLFDNCASLTFSRGNKAITGMTSSEVLCTRPVWPSSVMKCL